MEAIIINILVRNWFSNQKSVAFQHERWLYAIILTNNANSIIFFIFRIFLRLQSVFTDLH